MSLINLSIQHGQSLDEARRNLETAVHEVQSRFSVLIRQVEWSEDRSRVRLAGTGFWVEMWADAQVVYVVGDVLGLGGLLSGSMAPGLKQIVEQAFKKTLR